METPCLLGSTPDDQHLHIQLENITVRDDQSGYTRRTISRRFLTAFIRVSKDNPVAQNNTSL